MGSYNLDPLLTQGMSKCDREAKASCCTVLREIMSAFGFFFSFSFLFAIVPSPPVCPLTIVFKWRTGRPTARTTMCLLSLAAESASHCRGLHSESESSHVEAPTFRVLFLCNHSTFLVALPSVRQGLSRKFLSSEHGDRDTKNCFLDLRSRDSMCTIIPHSEVVVRI
jgi:hypothetical protein